MSVGRDEGSGDASGAREIGSETTAPAEADDESSRDIWRAAAHGNVDAMRRMIDEDPGCVNARDGAGYRALQWAALNNKVAAATLLLDRGSAIDAGDNDSQTALHWACVRGSLPCAELLLRRGANLNAADSRGYVPMHVAAQYGHTGMIYHFKMRWNAEVDVTDHDGRTALHWAAYKGFPDCVRLLICMDADIYRADKEGCTALHWSAMKGKSEATHLLVKAGGLNLLTAVDVDGNTAEALTAEKGFHSLTNFLVDEHRVLLTRDHFWTQKGMAVACLALILGLMLLFTRWVMFADGAATMDVTLAFWSLVVLASSGAGLYYMRRVSTADPGFITAATLSSIRRGARPSSAASDVDDRLNHSELWAGNWNQLCVSCKIVKPFGAKHCAMRDKCVARFDHHCPWMGNTIGKRNHRDFVVFLMLETFAMAVAFVVAVYRYGEENPSERFASSSKIVAFACFDACTLLPVLMLTISQLVQAAQNVTTNELANAHRYAYLKAADGTFTNPFDRGSRLANIRAFFFASKNEPLIDDVAAGVASLERVA